MSTPALLPRPAATLVLVRDTPAGIETLLMRRTEKAVFLAGAHVLPGGALGEADHADDLHALCAAQAAHDDPLNVLPRAGVAWRAAAIRECFEECGLLLACDASGAFPVIEADDPQWKEQRRRLDSGEMTLAALCDAQGLRLATERLAGFAHWITPVGAPRRYDTRFFVAVAPPAQTASYDGSEAVEHLWIRPEDALESARSGELKLVFATTTTVKWLARFGTTDALMAAARQPREIPVHEPRVALAAGAKRVLIRGHEAYAEVCRLDPLARGTASCELLPGELTALSHAVSRLVVGEVNSYLIGRNRGSEGMAVIDPGPDDPDHRDALLEAAAGLIDLILLTHTGAAQTGGAAALRALTGAPVVVLESMDYSGPVDRVLAHGECIGTNGVTFRAVHPMDGSARGYLLEDERTLFGPICNAPWPAGVQWHAAGRGFLQDRPFPPETA